MGTPDTFIFSSTYFSKTTGDYGATEEHEAAGCSQSKAFALFISRNSKLMKAKETLCSSEHLDTFYRFTC